jgi:ATP-dependent DNA helicase RecG
MTKEVEQIELIFESAVERPAELMSPQEIYVRADQIFLQKLKESRRFERKSSRIHPNALAEYLDMFANTPPDGGIIVVGLTNDGLIEGLLKTGSNRVNELERSGYIYCPEARYESKRLQVTNKDGEQDFVLLFYVQYEPRKLIENSKGEAFIRIGDSKHKLTDIEKLELKHAKGQIDLEREPCGLNYPDDFNIQAIHDYCSAFEKSRGLRFSPKQEDILVLSKLGEKSKTQFIPNISCALLFAKDPVKIIPGCKIRFLRFQGEEERTGAKFNVVKDILIEGRVPDLIQQAEKVIEAQVREFTRLGKNGRFFSAPEYPKDAWYEAVVNACVHRSYALKNMVIFVKMFDDRLVVESPGGFPPLVTPENIYDMHQPRNPHLMYSLLYLDFVKCAHEGTRRMRDTMQEMNLPSPEFSQEEKGGAMVQVILRNDITHRKVFVDTEAAKILGKAIFESLNDHERRVINYLAEQQKINVSEAQRLTAKSWPAAKKLLLGLVQKSILVPIRKATSKRDPGAYFVLRPPNHHSSDR